MTLVAVSQRMDVVPQYQETRDGLDHRWYAFLEKCNIIPLLTPNHPSLAQKIIQKIPVQGVLLTGGEDTPERANTESLLLEHALDRDLPVLGVCHGMQMIQRYFNINLIPISGHLLEQQVIVVHDQLDEVNSYHHLGTTETIPDLIVWAKAQDGVIKAIRHRTRPIAGIMWHPERYASFKASDIHLVTNFFAKGAY